MHTIKSISIVAMSLSYIIVGVWHFIDPHWFVKIMPPYLPMHYEAVYVSGFFEILLGMMLLFKQTRYIAAWGLILLLFAVFPANIYLIQSESAQLALGINKSIAIIRAPFQLLFIGLAYWHSKT